MHDSPRRPGKLALIGGAVVAVALLLALLGWQVLDDQEGSNVASAALAGERPEAPGFTLPALDAGGETSLESLRGQVVVVNFWASWCAPCREEAPALQEAWERWRDRGVVVLGVNTQDLSTDAKRFVADLGLTYPNVRDGEGSVSGRYGATGLPETVFVDRSGRIAVFRPGPVDAAAIEAGIQEALRS